MGQFLRATTLFLLAFCALPSFANNDKVDQSALIVQTRQGKIQGASEGGVAVWKGVNYAQAERFGVPKAPKEWTGIKPAVEFGPIAPQTESSVAAEGPQSEDCLSLNIWSPAADGKKRPVMVWIHGGGFVIGAGSSSLYYGGKLATKGDVVVVTINYRLGPLGFLYFKDNRYGFENNLGIRDQIAALQWVKDNIAAFGGDPELVTIFGESAGGTSVETLLSTKAAKGLFKRAIAESGPPAILWTPEVASMLTAKYLEIVHVSADRLHLLRTLPLDTVMAAEHALLEFMIKETNYKVFSPTIDGTLLTADLFKCQKPDIGGNVELMIGTNKDEATMFASKKLNMAPRTAEGLGKYFDEVTTKESKERVTLAYRYYPHKNGVIDILTDAVFRIPAIRLAECRSTYAPVYMYRFEWTSSTLNMIGLRSFHGLEIPFVFGNTEGKLGGLLKFIATKKLIKRLTGEMQGAWINFARYGNPNGKGEEVWKQYSTTERATMIFSRKSKIQQDPDGKQRAAWEGVTYY